MCDDKLLEKNIGDEFTCTGIWWVPRPPNPQNPKSTVYGTLTLTSEGKYELSTAGALDFEQSQGLAFIGAGEFPRLKTIWGATTSGEFMTLFDSDNTHWSTFACTYQATTVVATNSKRWFASVDDVAIDRLRLEYKHLVAWAGVSGFTALRSQDCCGAESGSFSFSIKRPFVLETTDTGNYVISLWIGRHFDTSNVAISQPKNAPPNFIYANKATFSIAPKEGKITIEASQELIGVISNFLSLMMGERTFVESIEGIVDRSDRQRIAIIRVFPSFKFPQLQATKQPHMLFTYPEITGLFKATLRKMFVKEMQPLYNQFFAELLHPSVYAEDEFMAAIRAIEVFHRRTMVGDYVVKRDYERYDDQLTSLVDTLLQQCDFETLEAANENAFKKSLYQKLKYGYQYSLQRRLKDLLRDQGEVFLELFVNKKINSEVRDDFVSKIVKTRNYYTHYDDEDKEAAITDPIELAIAAKRLIVFLYMLLLHYVGIPKQDVDAAIRKHSKDSYYRFGYLKAK